MQKALILTEFSKNEVQRLKKAAEGRCDLLIASSDWTRDQLLDAYGQADMIVGDPEPEDLAYCSKLKWMQTSWDGVAHYVATGKFGKNCELSNMAGAYSQVIAEFIVGMIVSLCHRFHDYYGQMREEVWNRGSCHKTLEGATVLILGAGAIGSELARKLRAFECRIVGMRRVRRACPPEFDEMITMSELDTYLPQADVVACCLPGTDETKGLFDRARLLRMKKDAILVNVGRGTLIQCNDLAGVLSEGHLWGAALDVTDPEPLPKNHPLWKQKNLLITPHASGNCFSEDSPTFKRIHEIMLSSFEEHLAGKPCRNVVDYATGYRELYREIPF